MATDMFGNILSPEEEERQRRHAEAMGLLPPALRVQMTAPFGGGIGPQLNQYQGMTGSSRVPHHSQPGGYFEQNITPIPTDVTVDPTMAGMAGVTQDYGPFSRSLGALSGMLAPAPSSSLPSYFDDPVVNEEMERVLAEEAATKVDDFAMLASQDPVASLGGWVKDVTKTVELPDIVEKKQTYAPMPRLSPEDMVPQTGCVPASTNVDYSQVMTDAGMAPVTMATRTSLPGGTVQAFSSSDDAAEVDEGFFGKFGDIARVVGGPLLNLDPDKADGYVEKQDIIERMVGLGLMNADQANQAKQWAWQTDTDTNFAQKMAQMLGTTTMGWLQMFDEETLDEGMKAWIANVKGTAKQADALVPGTIALIEEMTKGNIKPSELEALVNLDPGTVNSADIAEILSQVDTFADLADVDVQTQVDTFKDIDKIAADTAARDVEIAAAAAATRRDEQHANRRAANKAAHQERVAVAARQHQANVAAANERTRMNDLAAAQAAARHEQNVAAAKAKHEHNLRIAELTRQAAARQAQIAREVQDAQDRVRQATALMNSKSYQESGMDGLTAAERDIVAAAQVDTFAGIGAEGRMSEAEINVAGGMEFGGAGGMAGSDRGGGGRGGPGGRGR